jgi:hypothetical protein
VGKMSWSTTSACASVPGSSRVGPLTPDYPPKLATPCLLKAHQHEVEEGDTGHVVDQTAVR